MTDYTSDSKHRNPLSYNHPYPLMAEYARLLNLRHDSVRTIHSYYLAMRLVHDHFHCDPATLTQEQLRDYLLHVKTVKNWKPTTIRQTVACARLFLGKRISRDTRSMRLCRYGFFQRQQPAPII